VGFQPPAFIAFTGVDRIGIATELKALSADYPIEWGILVDDERSGEPLFPSASVRAELVSKATLRWAAHVCGAQAHRIANGPDDSPLTLPGFQRVQVNHGFQGSQEEQIGRSARFGRRLGVRAVLQCLDVFPQDLRVDWLFDTSFGRGSAPRAWPPLPMQGVFCGYSGGIAPHNVRETLEKIAAPPGSLYWIDMESGVRTNGWLDVAKCAAVCREVYG
jgi:hypothetical protein